MVAIILIHTSVKLVTHALLSLRWEDIILIHTSVKLVTSNPAEAARAWAILIHTSVKLVTIRYVHPRITHPF